MARRVRRARPWTSSTPRPKRSSPTVASGGKDDVDAAVAAARAALNGPWGKMSARERGRLVSKLADRLMEKADEVARLETLHNGKPIFESRQIEIPAAAECFEYYAGLGRQGDGGDDPRRRATTSPTRCASRSASSRRSCRGTSRCCWRRGRSRRRSRRGNVVILKPASQTPLTAIALGEIAVEVGLPPGVLNVITGPGSSVGQAIVEHPGIDKIAFTGDTSTGKGIMRAAADTLKKITLELGGKSPNIVLAGRRHRRRAARRDDRHLLRQG